ncbi:hypothetical protein PGSY75_1441000 [Plasmodium gaboni]|uniref:Cytoplasmic tRNA 2-thiolation protein 2 n=1 Tax=Plasmodium gaboni TaxID=647221 RepID=A0A151LAL8_9APIC|nr:hypothetical protein PGSY75_1441000 [Plasmodium gaboni]KYN96002.1 hypothetical protein PGSY75_1441000 [Plasmodium gaboni]
MNEQNIYREYTETKYEDTEKIKNTPLCYKCKKNNAVVYTREKSCKHCFLQLVEYNFKNTLREKCLFKSKTKFNQLNKRDIIQNDLKKKEKLNTQIEKSFLNEQRDNKNKKPDVINNNLDIVYSHVDNPRKNSADSQKIMGNNIEKNSVGKKIFNNINMCNEKKKRTCVAFSGGIYSSFLLYAFLKYLKNVKNRQSDLYISNEHAIFNEIIFVDMYDDINYIYKLMNIITNIFNMLDVEQNKSNINMNKIDIKNENENTIIMPNEKICFVNGIYKKQINKIHFVVIKNNYFINDLYKNSFILNYHNIKTKQNNYYMQYINELIIYNNIFTYCNNENIHYVLIGNNANNIANKTFLYTIYGYGISIPTLTSYIDKRHDNILFIRPLKDLLSKEIYIYSYYKNIEYINNNISNNNILYKTVNDMLLNLDNNNYNVTSIINNTTNNLINMMHIFNTCQYNINNTNNKKKEYNEVTQLLSSNEYSNHNFINSNKSCNITQNICLICYGNKENMEQKKLIIKLNKIQLDNIKNMKCKDFICSTCLCIFSSNNNFVKLYDCFF